MKRQGILKKTRTKVQEQPPVSNTLNKALRKKDCLLIVPDLHSIDFTIKETYPSLSGQVSLF